MKEDGFFSTVRSDAECHLESWSENGRLWHWVRLIFLCPGFQLVFLLRVQRLIENIPIIGRFLRRVIWYFNCIYFGCDIDPDARIGKGLYFPHPLGIVIGGGCVIGDQAMILQGVTMGRKNRQNQEGPKLGTKVEIGAGTVVVGDIVLGDSCVIGANSLLTKNVPDRTIFAGSPARFIGNVEK